MMDRAVDIISEKFSEQGKIPKEMEGYIASFGMSIRQSGLLTATAFYENKNSEKKKNRSNLMLAILDLIKDGQENEEDSLFEYVRKNKDKDLLLKEKIMDAATALKMAMRVFEFNEESMGEE
ncbi:type III-B CRISPR module-associated protein Cmr5 [Acetivibrio mesophilus]|nr:type III-B CRISPR module-associated protein Cmr5 [Acetivibrio mesophilus]